jgi:hypothetical protein
MGVCSDLDLKTGFITESVFVSASLNGSFQGTNTLFRLPVDGKLLQHGTLLNSELVASVARRVAFGEAPSDDEDGDDGEAAAHAAVASAAEESGFPSDVSDFVESPRRTMVVASPERRRVDGAAVKSPSSPPVGLLRGAIAGKSHNHSLPRTRIDTAASMVFDEPGDPVDIVPPLLNQFRRASPVPSRLPPSHAGSPRYPDKVEARAPTAKCVSKLQSNLTSWTSLVASFLTAVSDCSLSFILTM